MNHHCLTIAGSDSGGGAGIQADLKTFSALKTYGLSVITALTAQNTMGVDSFEAVSSHFVKAQLDAVFSDIPIDSVKIGMLAHEDIANLLADYLPTRKIPFLVLDTVMVAKGGHPLISKNTVSVIRDRLLNIADLITPNLPEAAALLNCEEATNEQDMLTQGKKLIEMGCNAVLMKGGHMNSLDCIDWLITPSEQIRIQRPRVATHNTHGTGCTLSSAITALYPRLGLVEAVIEARDYLQGALFNADRLHIGKGIGPTHHFYQWW